MVNILAYPNTNPHNSLEFHQKPGTFIYLEEKFNSWIQSFLYSIFQPESYVSVSMYSTFLLSSFMTHHNHCLLKMSPNIVNIILWFTLIFLYQLCSIIIIIFLIIYRSKRKKGSVGVSDFSHSKVIQVNWIVLNFWKVNYLSSL